MFADYTMDTKVAKVIGLMAEMKLEEVIDTIGLLKQKIDGEDNEISDEAEEAAEDSEDGDDSEEAEEASEEQEADDSEEGESDESDLVGINEAEELLKPLGINKKMIYYRIETGKMPLPEKKNGRFFWQKKELEEWAENLSNQ